MFQSRLAERNLDYSKYVLALVKLVDALFSSFHPNRVSKVLSKSGEEVWQAIYDGSLLLIYGSEHPAVELIKALRV